MKCFYHSADLDGHCSAAIVKKFRPECEMIPIDHGDPFPWDSIYSDEKVYMCDFSLQPFSEMLRLDDISDLTWIDHHESAINALHESGVRIDGIQRNGLGACGYTWLYFSYMDMPHGVRLLAEYDVWDHRDPDTLPFQYGMEMEKDILPEAAVWEEVLSSKRPARIIERGEVALVYDNQCSLVYANAAAFDLDLHGLNFIALNRMCCNSRAFETVYDQVVHDAMMAFGWRKGRWYVSMYTTKDSVKILDVARAYGGGGHAKACGFQCRKLPFELTELGF